MKVVLDTNVIVSRTISLTGAPATIVERWLQGSFELLVSAAILDEYGRTLSYPRIQQRIIIGAEAVSALIADIARVATAVVPEQHIISVSSDPDDDLFLECALAGSADYIVSGDRHLLALEAFRGIPIVPPAVFLMILDDRSPT